MITFKIELKAQRQHLVIESENFEFQESEISSIRVRTKASRKFNALLRRYKTERDVIISVYFHGQLKKPPYTSYSGSKSGVGGVVMSTRGLFEDM